MKQKSLCLAQEAASDETAGCISDGGRGEQQLLSGMAALQHGMGDGMQRIATGLQAGMRSLRLQAKQKAQHSACDVDTGFGLTPDQD